MGGPALLEGRPWQLLLSMGLSVVHALALDESLVQDPE